MLSGSGAFTVRSNVPVAVVVAESVMVMVYVVVGLVTVGVPLRIPVAGLRLSPAGNPPTGLVITYDVYVPDPPFAEAGLNGVTGLLRVSVEAGTSMLTVSGGSMTASVNVLLSVCPRESVTVILCVLVSVTLPIPVNRPLVNVSPAGGAGSIENVMFP